MTVRNTSAKVISIGTRTLMPDSELAGLSEAEVYVPGVQALVNMGFIKVVEEPAAAPAQEKPAVAKRGAKAKAAASK